MQVAGKLAWRQFGSWVGSLPFNDELNTDEVYIEQMVDDFGFTYYDAVEKYFDNRDTYKKYYDNPRSLPQAVRDRLDRSRINLNPVPRPRPRPRRTVVSDALAVDAAIEPESGVAVPVPRPRPRLLTDPGSRLAPIPRPRPDQPTRLDDEQTPIPRPRPRRTIDGGRRDIRLEDVPPLRLWNDPSGLTNARIEALISARRAAARRQ